MPMFFYAGETRFFGFNKLLWDLFTSFMNCLTSAWTLRQGERFCDLRVAHHMVELPDDLKYQRTGFFTTRPLGQLSR